MSEPYLGEIRLVGFNYEPEGWAFCDGRLLPIAQYDALFALIGTTYGGDGQTTFALPDLRGRTPIHMGQGNGLSNRTIGQNGGAETVTLSMNELPVHSHAAQAFEGSGTSSNPSGAVWAGVSSGAIYRVDDGSTLAAMNPGAVSPVGGSQPHDNLQPYLCVNFIIALDGVFPTQS